MNHSDLMRLDERHVWHPFTQAQTAPEPLAIKSAQGTVLHGHDGKDYLDLISSWWVTLHGHAHPDLARAIGEQAATLEQVIFANCTHEPAVTIAKSLADTLPGDLNRVFFSDDGSTAVEVALKACLQYWQNRGETQRSRFVAFHGAYHGDTVGAMSAGVSSKYFDAWKDMMFPVDTLDYPETWIDDPDWTAKEAKALADLEEHLTAHGPQTAAAIVEPLVQGASGMRMVPPSFLKKVVETLRRHGVLVIFDEVMTGFGRMGDLFACLKADVQPDAIALSKGLTGGCLAMSVTVFTDHLYEAFLDDSVDKAFLHGHSFTANPLGCAAANASWKLLTSEACTRDRARIEARHRDALKTFMDIPGVTNGRVMGTILALNVETSAEDSGYASAIGPRLKTYFHDRGLLIRPLGNVVYLLPPYCVTDAELDRGYEGIEGGIRALSL